MEFWSLLVVFLCFYQKANCVPVDTEDSGSSSSERYVQFPCNLPANLGYSSTGTFLEDCKNVDRFEIPVPYDAYGNVPRVCCPEDKKEVETSTDQRSAEYDYGDFYPFEPDSGLTVSEMNETCRSDSCVTISRCKSISPEIVQVCGMENNEMKVCCPDNDTTSEPALANKPRFPKNGKARECDDRSSFCSKWKQNGACALDQHFSTGQGKFDPEVSSRDMFEFMTLTCLQTCGWCGNKGCVDEHKMCQQWALEGHCLLNSDFMNYACRESCGTCGFLSVDSTEEQTKDGNSYSNISSPSFDCGRYKKLSELKDQGVEIFQDEFPERLSPNEDGECDTIEDGGLWNEDVTNSLDDEDDADATSFANQIKTGKFTCGLMLINDRWMLSAAHCYHGFTGHSLRVSSLRTYLPDLQETVLQRKIFIHPGFQFPKFYNDIALIQLGRRVTFDYEVLGDTPTCMMKNEEVDGRIASLTGYGETEAGNDAGEKLGTVNVTLINHEPCNNVLVNYLSSKQAKKEAFCEVLPFGLLNEHLCGKGEVKCTNGEKIYSGSCKGDSGGPVESEIDNKRTLVGLISGRLSCNSPHPEWFTKVGYFREWIECVMREAEGNQKSKDDVYKICNKYTSKRKEKKLDICT